MALLNVTVSIVGIICIALFLYFLGRIIFNFFPMIKNIRDKKYYVLGPLILMSDSYFLDKGAIHRKSFLKNGGRLLVVAFALIVISVYMSLVSNE